MEQYAIRVSMVMEADTRNNITKRNIKLHEIEIRIKQKYTKIIGKYKIYNTLFL